MTNLLLNVALMMSVHQAPVALFAKMTTASLVPPMINTLVGKTNTVNTNLAVVANPIVPFLYSNYSSFTDTTSWKLLGSTNLRVWTEVTNFIFTSLITNVFYVSNKLTGAVTPYKTNYATNVVTVSPKELYKYFRVQVNQ